MLKGKWRLESVLGAGGMAVVYRGVHRNGHQAAIKILHPHVAADDQYRRRFRREAYAANRVGHPNVPKIIDDDIAEDGSAFLVMDLLEGESLKARMTNAGGALPVDEVLQAAAQVLDVLAQAHEHGIVHRDIKPDNLFRTTDGRVHVLDFGIAGMTDVKAIEELTKSGRSMGTHGYMAPEQARGRWAEVDGQSDVFAVAASMFTLLSGRRVHEAETPNEVLLKEMTERATPTRERLPWLSDEVARWLDKGLGFEKKDRWSSAREMRDALRDLTPLPTTGASFDRAPVRPAEPRPAAPTASTVGATVTATALTRRRPRRIALIVAGLAVVLVGGVWLARLDGQAEARPESSHRIAAPANDAESGPAETSSSTPPAAPLDDQAVGPASTVANTDPPTRARPIPAPPRSASPRPPASASLLDRRNW